LADIKIKEIVEAALMAAGRPLSLDQMLDLFQDDARPDKSELRAAIDALRDDYVDRSIELIETGAGFRINVRAEYAQWVSRLWEERPPRYSRAMLETLALIAYRQPVTRGEIEDIRGVSVSSNIIKTLMERDWIKEVGHRDVPGKPALLATTKDFLNYFGLKSLNDLPTLSEIKDLDSINRELELDEPDKMQEQSDDDNTDLVQLDVSEDHTTVDLDEPDLTSFDATHQEDPEHE
jgi:segregation and condensation protein B